MPMADRESFDRYGSNLVLAAAIILSIVAAFMALLIQHRDIARLSAEVELLSRSTQSRDDAAREAVRLIRDLHDRMPEEPHER
jgi:hypothetical protein